MTIFKGAFRHFFSPSSLSTYFRLWGFKGIWVLIFCLSGTSVQANQPTSEKTLTKAVLLAQADSTRSSLYGQLSDFYGEQLDKEQQLIFSDSCIKYARLDANPLLLLKAYGVKGRALAANDQMDASLQLLEQATLSAQAHPELITTEAYIRLQIEYCRRARISQSRSSQEIIAHLKSLYQRIKGKVAPALESEVLSMLVRFYRASHQLGQALYYNNLMLKTIAKSNDQKGILIAQITDIDIYYNLATRPIDSTHFAGLIKKCEQAYQFSIEADLPIYQPWPLLYLSKFHLYAGDHTQAQKVLDQIDDDHSETRVSYSKYDLLADIARDARQLEQMYRAAHRSREYALQANNHFFQLKIDNTLLFYFLQEERSDSSRYYARWVEQGLARVDTSQYLEMVSDSYELLSQFYKTKDLPKAMALLETANGIRDKRIRYQQQALADIAQYRKEVELLTSDRKNLSESAQVLKQQQVFLIGFVILLVLIGLFGYHRSRKLKMKQQKLEQKKREAEKAVRELSQKVQKDHLILNNKIKVYLEELRYIKSDGNYIEFHVLGEKHLDRNRLKQVVEQLPPNFVQVHRSYIINRNFIKLQQANTLILEPNIEIPVSRTYRTHLLN